MILGFRFEGLQHSWGRGGREGRGREPKPSLSLSRAYLGSLPLPLPSPPSPQETLGSPPPPAPMTQGLRPFLPLTPPPYPRRSHRAHTRGARKEGAKINASLAALKECIRAPRIDRSSIGGAPRLQVGSGAIGATGVVPSGYPPCPSRHPSFRRFWGFQWTIGHPRAVWGSQNRAL